MAKIKGYIWGLFIQHFQKKKLQSSVVRFKILNQPSKSFNYIKQII
jgi:hypothetical protein